jgi:hypothetical protein
MKFHAAILTRGGDVTAKAGHDGDVMGRNGVSRRMMDRFKRLLRENLTEDPTRCGKFRAQFGDSQHILEWLQVEPLSAIGKFYVRGGLAGDGTPNLDLTKLEPPNRQQVITICERDPKAFDPFKAQMWCVTCNPCNQ